MQCDPNTIARASSCLRCLSDGQLMIMRTYLMCRWLRAIPAGSAPGAPTNPDIGAGSASDNVIFMWANGSPVGTTNEIWKSTDGTNFALFATVAGGIIQKVDNSIMAAGNIWYYKVRSCNGTSCSAFSSVVSVSFNFTSPNVASVSFPTLIRAFGFFKATGLAALTSVSLPALKKVDGIFDLSTNANLTTVTLTALTIVGAALFFGNDNITGALSLPVLATIGGDLQFQSNPLMTSLSIPLLTTVGGLFVGSSCLALVTITATVLFSVNGRLDLQSCNSLVSASFPALLLVNDDIIISGPALTSILFPVLATTNPQSFYVINANANAALTTVNIPVLTITDGFIMGFTNCGLNAASVNQILARGVASGVTATDFELAGGTNAAPSGQGVIDKATLIGAGNTCNTN